MKRRRSVEVTYALPEEGIVMFDLKGGMGLRRARGKSGMNDK